MEVKRALHLLINAGIYRGNHSTSDISADGGIDGSRLHRWRLLVVSWRLESRFLVGIWRLISILRLSLVCRWPLVLMLPGIGRLLGMDRLLGRSVISGVGPSRWTVSV